MKPRPKKTKSAADAGADDAAQSEILKLDNQICFPIYAASRLLVNAYRPLLDALELTYPQYLVMLVLWETDGPSVKALGDRLLLDSGTLTPVLKRMEKLGLIARKRSAEDDRVVGNWLTPRGRALKKKAASVPVELLCNAGLTLEDLPPIRQGIDRMIAALLPLQPKTRGSREE